MNPPAIFNGYLTLHNRKTGEHRTFRIRTQKKNARFAPGKRVISLLTGPDNTSHYQQFGFVDEHGIHVWDKLKGEKVWHRKTCYRKSKYEWFAIMLWGVATDSSSNWARDYELLIEGRCIICNRLLTEPTSIKSGVGPVCAGR